MSGYCLVMYVLSSPMIHVEGCIPAVPRQHAVIVDLAEEIVFCTTGRYETGKVNNIFYDNAVAVYL